MISRCEAQETAPPAWLSSARAQGARLRDLYEIAKRATLRFFFIAGLLMVLSSFLAGLFAGMVLLSILVGFWLWTRRR